MIVEILKSLDISDGKIELKGENKRIKELIQNELNEKNLVKNLRKILEKKQKD